MPPRATHALVIPLLLFVAGCQAGAPLDLTRMLREVPDEEKISALLDDVHQGMVTKKLNRVMAHVSPEYMDMEGRDYDAIRAYVSGIMKDYREIIINRTPPTVVVQGNRARAIEAFGTQATPDSDRVPPLNIQGQVSVYLERGENGWKIVEWGSIG